MYHFASPKQGERLIWWRFKDIPRLRPSLGQKVPAALATGLHNQIHNFYIHNQIHLMFYVLWRDPFLPQWLVAVITEIICSNVTSSQRCHLKLKIHVKTRDVTLLSRQFRPELLSQCLVSLPTCSEELSQATWGCLALQLTVFHLKHHFVVEIQASNSLGFNLGTFY